ncbi:MAG: tripartite tricarboxylate transporter substrate binding protein [Betaproteobacteria bacterium]|nr:tripartite tricarboxylate transporter substrate binding protein [Betaproteobacteria bacterium]
MRLIALNPPGGVSDTLARAIGEKLAERLGQPFVIDNRVGAGGIIGSEIVARAQPDGHTLLMGFIGNLAINPGLYKKLPYDPIRDFAPVSLAGRSPLVVVAHRSLPVKSIRDLIALAKAQPGALNFSSSGSGNGTHLAAELFRTMAGIKMTHVPYKGGPPAMTAVIAGEVSLTFSTAPPAIPQVKAGRVKALAVTTERRIPTLPEVPTVAESGFPDYVVTTWFGVVAPAATPRQVVRKLNREIVDILGDRAVLDRIATAGLIAAPSSPEQFADLIKSETVRWAKVIKESGAKAD